MKLDYDEFAVYVCGRYGVSVDEAKTGCTFMELGIDSLSIYSMVGELENKYTIKIDTDDISEIDSLPHLYDYVKRKVEN